MRPIIRLLPLLIALVTSSAGGELARYDYDARGYQTKVTHADGLAESKSFDPNGNEATSTDRAGRVTTNTYDLLDRLTNVAYAHGKSVTNGYDAVRPSNEVVARWRKRSFFTNLASSLLDR